MWREVCGKPDHRSQDCFQSRRNPETEKTTGAQDVAASKPGKCFRCGGVGHYASACGNIRIATCYTSNSGTSSEKEQFCYFCKEGGHEGGILQSAVGKRERASYRHNNRCPYFPSLQRDNRAAMGMRPGKQEPGAVMKEIVHKANTYDLRANRTEGLKRSNGNKMNDTEYRTSKFEESYLDQTILKKEEPIDEEPYRVLSRYEISNLYSRTIVPVDNLDDHEMETEKYAAGIDFDY